MTRPRAATYHYSINRDDSLTSVSNTWIYFARENDAPELTRDHVLHRSLWEFVAGPQTRGIYEVLFGWVRRYNATVTIPFRCDSPDCMRFMHLTMTPSQDDGIDLSAILDAEERRPHMRILERLSPRSDYAFPLCSFCRRIFVFGAWLEPEEAVQRLGWLETEAPPEIDEDICDQCARRARVSLEPSTAAP